ncbi:MAG: GTP-binding protein [Crocinitomicaceae bacterium]|nr:GTP-binding protein [Crocinitomicaceae bacterium]
MELLKFFTAGNVDDGKSTLIGRLLYDSKSISTDIIETLTRQSKVTALNAEIDLALLTDGLRAEREQGITIDVAYKYFSTEKRKFIIADTPGHIQYTRNMFTGASNADMAIILVDARNGITEQTKRHSIISSLLSMPHIMVCVNKMDLVGYDEKIFRKIADDYLVFAKKATQKEITFIPVSALAGDNVVTRSTKMPWYKGQSVLEHLEQIPLHEENSPAPGRFQVQYVIRPQTSKFHDYRGFAGKILGGSFHKGQEVELMPSAIRTTLSAIEVNGKEVESAEFPQPVVLHLKDDIDLSRGDSIVPVGAGQRIDKDIEAIICWMDNLPFKPGQRLLLQQNSFRTKASIKNIIGNIDIHSMEEIPNEAPPQLNDICKVKIKSADSVVFDRYTENRYTGSFILIDENSNNTVAAGMIE